MQKRNVLGALALLGLLVNPLAALADTPARPTLTVWYALKAPYGNQYGQLLKGYETTHPYLVIEPHNYNDSDSLRHAVATSTTLPDVILVNAAWQDDLISGERIVPMEDLMAGASNMARIVCKADTFPPLFQLSLRDGKLWTLPTFCTDTALIYQPAMFASKKITKLPLTWGDLLTDAKKLTDTANGVWGFQLPISQSGMDMGRLFSLMMWQMGADLTNMEDPTAPPSASDASPKTLAMAPPPSPAVPPAAPPKVPATIILTPGVPPAPGTPAVAATPAAPAPVTPTQAAAPATPGAPPTAPVPAAPATPAATPATPGAPPTAAAPAAPATPAATAPAAPAPAAPVAPALQAAPVTTATPTPSERLMSFLIDMVYRYKVSPSEATDDPTKIAMMIGTPETLLAGEAKGIKLDAAPFPINKVKVSEMELYNFAVTKDARDPKEAYQFVLWSAGFEQSLVWSTTTPYLPANKQVTLSPDYFSYLGQHPGLKTFLKEMGVGRLEPTVSHYTRVLNETHEIVAHAIAAHENAGDVCHHLVDKTRYIINMPHTSTDVPSAH